MATPSTTQQTREIGDRLLREALAGTHHGAQAEFARRMEIGLQSWNNYERGHSRIELDAALRIARKTGVLTDWIYLGLHEDALPSSIREKIASRRRETMNRVASRMG